MRLKTVLSTLLLSAFAYITLFHSPVIRGLELTNLLFYMDVWPAFLSAAGYSAAHLANGLLKINPRSPRLTALGLSASAAIVAYWHFPVNSFFGFGVCPADLNDPVLYQMKRTSYLAAGAVIYFSVVGMSKPWREALAIALGKVMGWYGFVLTLVEKPLYAAPPVIFSVQLHHEAGFAMLITMVFLDFVAVASLVNHYFKNAKPEPYPLTTRH
ncbi:MAG: hypothetical protein QXO30_01430 [Candidatus Caldarchaeum sp.]